MTTALKPTIRGVGINDVRGSHNQSYYKVWEDMFRRSYCPVYQQKNITYIGCTVHPHWHYLSNFKQWYEEQGDVTGKQLDKDIISPNNKVYGPDTCLFVSPQLNTFFVRSDKLRGKYPIGVYKDTSEKRHKPFMVRVRDTTSKKKFIGYYATPEEAYQAFIQAKKELLLEKFILPETDQRLKQALYNVYNNMEEYFK